MKIGNRVIDQYSPPLIIAEMSGNHNQSLDRALQIVDAAANAGADAIKLQTYTADTMTLDLVEGDFFISDPSSLWSGQSMAELYRQAYTPWEWHDPIMRHAKTRGLICFSSPFDESAVDFLEDLEVPAYKIASFECVDLPLIRKVAATGKPLILSTGMATVEEVSEAVEAARGAGCSDLILLKCTSTYPASPENSHIRSIPAMQVMFGCGVGLSDHTLGLGAAISAIALGARVIEKHFTLSRNDGGVDAAFSLEPEELAALVLEARRAWQALGEVRIGPAPVEESARQRRRSLYIGKTMKRGDRLTPENLRRIRPGHGLSPKYYEELLGKVVNRDIARGTPVSWDLFED